MVQRSQAKRPDCAAAGGDAPAAAEAAIPARAAFVAALVRLKRAQGLYGAEPGKVEFLGSRLFRTTLILPDNVPIGRYRIEVYEVHGERAEQTSLDLQIEKTGFEAGVFDLAQTQGLAYGLFAVALALMAGWAASAMLRG